MPRLMDFDFLLKTELRTSSNTSKNIYDAESSIVSFLNLFFKYNYYMRDDFEPESEEHYFHSLAFFTYSRLPYSIRAIYKIWETGFYLEALVLLRHVVEGFVQLRYFFKYKDKIKTHFEATRSKGRIQFKTMFDEFTDGFNEIIYGKFYSRFAHGHFVASIFRANFTQDKKRELIYGCQYDDLKSKLVINQLGMFCYAYLNFIEIFFPKFSEALGEKDYHEYLEHLEKLRAIMLEPKETEEFQKDFDKMIKPLIEK